MELEEVEARNEDFSMTLGFLELMNVMTETPIPAALGAGYRAPGFEPYLNYLRDSIFLKFNTRAYKDPAQRVISNFLKAPKLHSIFNSHFFCSLYPFCIHFFK